MLESIIRFSLKNKLIILLLTFGIAGYGVYALFTLPIGAVPDITNNQVQVITTSRNLSTQDVEQFITYPVELEMANLPGVKEIRSVSKFGLSVVTIVFEEETGTYLPRQLIAEKLKSVEENIPASFGQPFMGPITTGLGEIYQYTLEVDDAHKKEYSLSDLRTIQDWQIKRKLSGIKGVVEVNTWGGYLKQYEVQIDPSKLNAMNIDIPSVYRALEGNNSISGGSYIEKANEAFFIRGEGNLTSLEDIENVVVENREGTAILIKDVASVHFGKATRFGAITGNGEGEKVMGQIMMLKDANSSQVIHDVNQRIAEIQDQLPDGISIVPILERSELIGKTTFTISENLILGCLIVIFIVVLLLGNLRSGLVIASVIPLCLLVALSFMKIFGVDANLMSLGAIDFGIIIDGAVIIVEFVAFQIAQNQVVLRGLNPKLRQEKMDEITLKGANKMMHSAIFGQLIILIVFIPILSLSGVEGKMFIPMALVFIFALLGAMFFCLTYVPVVSSLFLKAPKSDVPNFSARFMNMLENRYATMLQWILTKKKSVIAIAGVLLVGAFLLFSRMGGEFVPTLDEGDFVIQPVLKTGTTLTNTVELCTKMEQIILKFPEVEKVVSRIGAAEIPTDPMSMEESDVIIKLKPKSEWTVATKDELADKLKEALLVLPGIEYEFTQPIEMRFNELITGVRADLAIKLFGEDLSILAAKSEEISDLIANVAGASDISVEKIAGLPQMTVKYNKEKLAKYGLKIAELNDLVSLGFAGMKAGNIFEGEKRFDLVLRLEDEQRNSIDDLENLFVPLPQGGQIPLGEVAEISYSKGPAKISRDDTKRRVVVGVNVRGRDLESVVKDVQHILDTKLTLPKGYELKYGGQFENLRSARARLSIAVPVALVLIFVLLYFAFKSVKDAMMVYSAIPLAAVGGILFLFMRDLPFSISAGVGFIALFGIAVLNGIVLIEHYKELEHEGIRDLHTRIVLGTKQRLRPVLLTASAAALGFLPMAISGNAGAEVQRPLATVVIGGLISATILTLFVLPVLYSIFHAERNLKIPAKAMVLLVGLALSSNSFSQSSLEFMLEKAAQNNLQNQAVELQVAQAKLLEKTAWNIDKTMLYVNQDKNNLPPLGGALFVTGIQQSLQFPTVYVKQKGVLKAQSSLVSAESNAQKNSVNQAIYSTYNTLLLLKEQEKLLRKLDSLYTKQYRAIQRKLELQESSRLEFLNVEAKLRAVQLKHAEIVGFIEQGKLTLKQLTQTVLPASFDKDTLYVFGKKEGFDGSRDSILQAKILLASKQLELERNKLLPDLHFQYFQGRNLDPNGIMYPGFQLGLSLPLSVGAQKANLQANQQNQEIAEKQYQSYSSERETSRNRLQIQEGVYLNNLRVFTEQTQGLVDESLRVAERLYQLGEIDFFQFSSSIEQAFNLQTTYWENVHALNAVRIELQFLP
jgi:cobalt-zinc-cadmium resistance protein CzcA